MARPAGLVDEAVRAGHTVTAAVRDPARVTVPPRVRVVPADVRDATSVRSAVRECGAVVSAIGPAGRRAGGLYSAWATAVVDAMPRGGRVVALSSSGVRRGDPDHPLWYRVVARTLLGELYGDMRGMERILEGSALDWTSVRPVRITDTPPTGTPRVRDNANPPGGRAVARTDLARFVIATLTDPTWSRAYPTVAA